MTGIIDRLDTAQRELAVVQYAVRQGDACDAVGRLADVVGDVLREVKALATSSDPSAASNQERNSP